VSDQANSKASVPALIQAFPFSLLKSSLSVTAIENLARLHLEELEGKGVVKPSGARDFDDVYEFDMMKAMEYNGTRGWYLDA
jgi:hypothetical protein